MSVNLEQSIVRARVVLPIVMVCTALGWLGGCDKKSGGASSSASSSESAPGGGQGEADAEAMAQRVLKALQAEDTKTLVELSDSRTREQLGKLSDSEIKSKWKVFSKWRWDAVKKWDGKLKGVRYRHYVGTAANDYEADVRFYDMSAKEVATINLRREQGLWRFSGINSPSTTEWEKGREKFADVPEAY